MRYTTNPICESFQVMVGRVLEARGQSPGRPTTRRRRDGRRPCPDGTSWVEVDAELAEHQAMWRIVRAYARRFKPRWVMGYRDYGAGHDLDDNMEWSDAMINALWDDPRPLAVAWAHSVGRAAAQLQEDRRRAAWTLARCSRSELGDEWLIGQLVRYGIPDPDEGPGAARGR